MIRDKVQGSVDPGFAAGLPFWVPESLDLTACRYSGHISQNLPAIFP